jgi:probable rRNA maturation factor
VGIDVELSDTQGHLRVDPAELSKLVRHVLVHEGRAQASISIALVDHAAIHAVNRTYLSHDWPTDVISFPLSTADEPVLAGELIVSAEMAVSAAAAAGAEPCDELALYIVHGLLHLCGYEDASESGAAVMRLREDEILSECGYSNPLKRDASAFSSRTRAASEGKAELRRPSFIQAADRRVLARSFPETSEPCSCSD